MVPVCNAVVSTVAVMSVPLVAGGMTITYVMNRLGSNIRHVHVISRDLSASIRNAFQGNT